MTESAPPVLTNEDKKKIGVQRATGIVVCTFFVAVLAISNMDALGKGWLREGSLVPATYCFEIFTSIQSVLGVKNDRLATAWTDLANCYSKVPRYRDAIRASQRAIKIRTELFGNKSYGVVVQRARIGEYLAKDKRYAEADKVLAEALKESEAASPVEPISHAYILEAMTRSYIGQQRWGDAIYTATQLKPVDDDLFADGRVGFDGRELLAEIYSRCGKPDLAQKEAEESLRLKAQHMATNPVSVALAHETLGKVLVCSSKKDAAADHFKQAISLLGKEYDSHGEQMQYWRARYDHLLDRRDPFSE